MKTLVIGLGTLVLVGLTQPALAQRCLSFPPPAPMSAPVWPQAIRTRPTDSDRPLHPLLKEAMKVPMAQRGEIVVERLTGNRAMVIHVVSPEEITCRFADGRLEGRFMFEVEPQLSPFGSLVWFFLSGFVSRWFGQGAGASVTERLRLVRPSQSSRSPLTV